VLRKRKPGRAGGGAHVSDPNQSSISSREKAQPHVKQEWGNRVRLPQTKDLTLRGITALRNRRRRCGKNCKYRSRCRSIG
jgi:hypothetical protein